MPSHVVDNEKHKRAFLILIPQPLYHPHSLNRNNHQFSVSLPNNSLLKLTLDVNLLHANTIGPGHNIHVI